MTPEELNRTMEFIVASQARLVAVKEQDREDRLAFQRRLADLQRQQAELLVRQSERLDSFQKFHDDWLRRTNDFQARTEDFQARTEAFQVQALRLLNMILDRLPPAAHT